MKIVLSRKGYDAENGGAPSPILPDGTLVSLPIPSSRSQRRYCDLHGPDGGLLGETLRDLAVFPGDKHAGCHLDPDLARWSAVRANGWRPAFGPGTGAAGHLDNQGVGIGDLFLFFGWFRRTEVINGKLSFIDEPHSDLHVIFGWLEVGNIVRPRRDTPIPSWLKDHPHCAHHLRENKNNRIYIASEHVGIAPERAGGGVFRYSDRRVLTKPGMKRTRWALDPDVFEDVAISYHSAGSWKDSYFQSASKGQEFVFSANTKIASWLRHVFSEM